MVQREFLGVYSQKKRTNEVRYYFVWRQGNMYRVQKLDTALNPVDILTTVDEHSFRTYFTFEPDIEKTPASEKIISQKISTKDNAAELREKSLRELFHLSVARLHKNDSREKALQEIIELLAIEEGIVPEHKHMFAYFGIQLRKKHEFTLALCCCERVLSLAPNDDHAHYNMARVLLEMHRYDEALEQVRIVLDVDPNNTVYLKTWEYIQKVLGNAVTRC